ncbi:hypothetical protein QJQ45_003838 [Haematococcus lacustris]|nr:hypothetical protein QJQ45_003838 [Haematococcus lacustris]
MATPVSPTPDTQDPHPPAKARGWTQQHKKKTVSVLDLYNQLKQSNAVRDTLSEQQQADLAPTVSRLAGASIGAAIRELNAFENAEWNAAMKRRAQSMLQMQTLQQPTQPGQPSFTPIASIEARQSFWKLQAAPQFPILAKAAQRLLSAHASTAAAERNWSMWGHTYHNALRNNFSVEAAKREVYLKANVPTTDSDDDTPAVQDTLIDIMN